MKPNEYQELAQRTVMPSVVQQDRIVQKIGNDPDLSHVIMGALKLCSESGELSDALVKHLCYNQPLDKENILEECGDLLWYIALILQHSGFTMQEAMASNIAKLVKRYPDKYSDACAFERKDKSPSEEALNREHKLRNEERFTDGSQY